MGRKWLALILLVQALLSLRLRNTVFQDEALYLWAGHLELGRGSEVEFVRYFSGSPYLYPPLGALADAAGGLAGARALSLAFMLGATALAWSLTRRLAGEAAAPWAAAVFAILPSTPFLGNFATFDAPALFLLALAARLAADERWWWAAGPAGALAAGTKYGAALYLPTIALLAVLASGGGARRWVRGPVVAGVALGGLAALLAATGAWDALSSTTTGRPAGGTPAGLLLTESAQWGGFLLLLAVIGAAAARTPIGWILCATALLAPLYQLHLHSDTSLHKHIGFGLWFAAPMAGAALAALPRRWWAAALLVAPLLTGIYQAGDLYHRWPGTAALAEAVRPYVKPGARLFAEPSEVLPYTFRAAYPSDAWVNVYWFDYRGLRQPDSYPQAVRDGHWDAVVLDGRTRPALSRALEAALRATPSYQRVTTLPWRTSTARGTFQLWIRTTP
ncbi:glycosyltransferase family 39 protein [Actinocorallia longicatena]|uniref:DUF3824 domain-containing protein n=1 Tax=Actinocorallia longicatena TaxID=111803 RepID=A0ABP6Q2P5_9ACTN